jgi:hypothetical protein
MDNEELPRNPREWSNESKVENVEYKTIDTIALTSGSTSTMEQYLMLRVLQVKDLKDPTALDPAKFDLEKWSKEATDILRTHLSWKSYVDNFSGKLQEGTFALPLFYQRHVVAMPHDAEFQPNIAVSPIAHRTRGQLKREASGSSHLKLPDRQYRPHRLFKCLYHPHKYSLPLDIVSQAF